MSKLENWKISRVSRVLENREIKFREILLLAKIIYVLNKSINALKQIQQCQQLILYPVKFSQTIFRKNNFFA